MWMRTVTQLSRPPVSRDNCLGLKPKLAKIVAGIQPALVGGLTNKSIPPPLRWEVFAGPAARYTKQNLMFSSILSLPMGLDLDHTHLLVGRWLLL